MCASCLESPSGPPAAGVGTPEQTWGVSCIPAPGTEQNKHSTEPWLESARRPVYRQPFNNTCGVYQIRRYDTVASVLDNFELDVTSGIRQFVRRYLNREYDGTKPSQLVTSSPKLFSLVQYMYKISGAFQPGEEKVVKQALSVVYRATVVPLGYGNKADVQPYLECQFYDSQGTLSIVRCHLQDEDVTQCTRFGTVGCTLMFWDADVTKTLNAGTKVSTLCSERGDGGLQASCSDTALYHKAVSLPERCEETARP